MHGPECRCIPRIKNSEEEKSFAARKASRVRQTGNMGQMASLECRHRIFDKKSAGLFFAKLLANKIECGPELERPPARIMSVAGNKVDQSFAQPPP